MKELSIQIKVYPVSNMRQDVYRFMADEFVVTSGTGILRGGPLFQLQ
mgnify:CR=1 FL=1